jgi:ABC-type transport system involved in cytochrome bd biosynthesis fused ATPase/permease subunit
MEGVSRNRNQYGAVTTLLLLMVLGLLGYASAEMSEVSRSVAEALRSRSMDNEVLTSEWTSGGIKKTYTTTQEAGESQADHAKRHSKGLAAALVEFPKDE